VKIPLAHRNGNATTSFVTVNKLGQTVLDPRKTIPAHEAWIFEDKKILASIKRGLKQAAAGKTKRMGSFARHAEESSPRRPLQTVARDIGLTPRGQRKMKSKTSHRKAVS
jgi:hypothetical protein